MRSYQGGIELPDILTHLFVGMSLAVLIRGPRIDHQGVLIVFGALLPDIERPLTWLLTDTDLYWLNLLKATHSLFGLVVLSVFVASCFESDLMDYRSRFYLVAAGGLTHLLSDLVLYPWKELGLYLFYPLKVPFSLNLIWPDHLFFPIVGLMLFLCAVLMAKVIELVRGRTTLFRKSSVSEFE